MEFHLKDHSKHTLFIKIIFFNVVLLLFLLISIKLDFGDKLLHLLLIHEKWELDEIVLTLFIAYLFLLFISFFLLFEYMLLSKRKNYRENIYKKTIQEKELILHEANHRIKNNLALISSLINLKLGKTQNEELKKNLLNITTKINSISLIHEKLYRNNNLSEINFSEYIKSLIQGLAVTYFTNSGKIQLDIINKDIFISNDIAVPLGLVISEIITNAVKYGIRDNNDIITISLKQEKGDIKLTVSNTGNAFPENIELNTTEAFGLNLINSLVRQIDGNMVLEKKPFTKYIITF